MDVYFQEIFLDIKHSNDLRPNTNYGSLIFLKIYPIMTTIILLQRPEYTLLMQLGLPGGSEMLILRNHLCNKITRVILNSKREALPWCYLMKCKFINITLLNVSLCPAHSVKESFEIKQVSQ